MIATLTALACAWFALLLVALGQPPRRRQLADGAPCEPAWTARAIPAALLALSVTLLIASQGIAFASLLLLEAAAPVSLTVAWAVRRPRRALRFARPLILRRTLPPA